jgi:catechol 2,3-dioxygenase-like lactoylglutathione lyase family enzyme
VGVEADHGIRFGRIAATLPVGDIARALDCYTRVLGFTVEFANGDPVAFAILTRDAAELHLIAEPGHRPAASNVAHRMVEDVNGLHALCRRHGLRIVKHLEDKGYGLRSFVFEDPDGNRIDVGQPI